MKLRMINHAGKSITLKLSTMEAAIIAEALRMYAFKEIYNSDKARKMLDIMNNHQEVLPGKGRK